MSLSQVETYFLIGGLLMVLQGSVFVHYMPQILSQIGIDTAIAKAILGSALFIEFSRYSRNACIAVPSCALIGDKEAISLEAVLSSVRTRWEEQIDSNERRVVIELYESAMDYDQPLKELLKEFDPDEDSLVYNC